MKLDLKVFFNSNASRSTYPHVLISDNSVTITNLLEILGDLILTGRGRRSELRSPKIGKKGGFLRIAQELCRISGHGFQDSVAFVDARILKKNP